jgi:hypothetical protein
MKNWEAIILGIRNCSALLVQERKDAEDNLRRAVREGRIDSAIALELDSLFTWSKQPEGGNYWRNLDEKVGDCSLYYDEHAEIDAACSTVDKKRIRDVVLAKIFVE